MCENVRCDDRGCVHLKGGSKDRRAGRAPNVGRVSCWRSLVQTIPNSEAVSWGYWHQVPGFVSSTWCVCFETLIESENICNKSSVYLWWRQLFISPYFHLCLGETETQRQIETFTDGEISRRLEFIFQRHQLFICKRCAGSTYIEIRNVLIILCREVLSCLKIYLLGFELFPCDFPSPLRFESLTFESVSLPSISLPSASSHKSSGSMSLRSFTGMRRKIFSLHI